MIHMTHGGFQQRLRRRLTILLLQILLQRSGVNADADRNIFVTRAVHNGTNTLFIADVAWVDAQAVDAILRHLQRNTVVKVDIRDQRNADLLFDELKGFRRVHGRHGNTDDIRAHALQGFDLINRRFHIRGTRIGH